MLCRGIFMKTEGCEGWLFTRSEH